MGPLEDNLVVMFTVCYSRGTTRDDDQRDFTTKKGTSVVNSSTDTVSGARYKPKTSATKSIYEVMLNFIQEAVGDQVGRLIALI